MDNIDIQGVQVPVLGFGTWQLEGDDAYRPVRDALELGYRHIDTAQIYGNEAAVGRAIADSDVDRDDIFLTTKVWRAAAATADVRRTTEESLRTLGVDHLDLLLIHWPAEEIAPVEETVEALDQLRQEGKTRLIGVSNYPTDLVRRALAVAPIATDQVEHHPYLAQDKLRALLVEHGLFLTAYSPIAQGEVLDDEVIREIAAGHDRTPIQVTLRWLLQSEATVAIPRSSRREHIASNAAVFDFELTDDEMSRISALDAGRRLVSPGFAPAWD